MLSWLVRSPGGRELRSDEKKLFARVRQTLWDYEPLRASHAEIVIDVRDREVRLSGRVRTLAQKMVAEALVRRMDGLDDVVNELVADAEVVRAVTNALAEDAHTAGFILLVESSHGVVTLRGDVPSEEVRETALEIASQVPLVAVIRDALAVTGAPHFDPSSSARNSDPAERYSRLITPADVVARTVAPTRA